MGIEHDQLAAITALFHGEKPILGDGLVHGNFTPNQQWLAMAVALGRGDKDAAQRILAAYDVMAKVGHQAVGTGYANEQGCPDPHSGLWAGAHGFILWWAFKNRNSALLLAALDYWAAHIAMCREFWTPRGVRTPCSRAIYTLAKDVPGATNSPRPNWTIDSRIYAMIAFPAMPPKAAIAAYGNIAPADPFIVCLDLMAACGAYHKDILTKSTTVTLKLAVPIRRWTLPDGFDAAMVEDTPMNDRMSWVAVDKQGGILNSGKTLSTFVVPKFAPDAIGGPGGTVVRGVVVLTPGLPPVGAVPHAPIIGPVGEMVGGVGRKPTLWQRIVAWWKAL